MPTRRDPDLAAPKLINFENKQVKGKGRPNKFIMPPLPTFDLEPGEQALFEGYQEAFKQQYPDLIPIDLFYLHMAAVSYVLSLRVAKQELESGQVITMARQHPAVQWRAYVDRILSRLEKASKGMGDQDSEEKAAAKAMLMSLSQG